MTTSQTAVLSGVQEPRYRPAARKRSAHVDDCAFLANAYGLTPDPWQMTVLECWLATEKDGRMRAGRCGLAVPRQNGKNAILEMIELYFLVVLHRKILHTAHEVKTARKAFLRLAGFFENDRQWPELAALVKEIRRTNGQEAVVLHNGGSIEFIARSRGSGRGYTVDVLVCDEAQELTDEQLEALLPTISSAPSGDPQQIYTGTPPGPTSPGTVFRRMREAGIARKDPRLSWVEWSVAEVGDIYDRHRVAATNPALGIRLQMSVIDDELGQMTPEGYARERLGWWSDHGHTPPVLDSARWRELATDAAPEGGVAAYGVRFTPDGARVGVAVAVTVDGVDHVEAIAVGAAVGMHVGDTPLAEWLLPRARTGVVVVDGKAGAGALVESLLKLGASPKRVIVPIVDQIITAHTQLVESVNAGTLTHFDQSELNAAVAAGGRRDIGKSGGWGWQAIGDGDVLPLEAATLATIGSRRFARSGTRDPGRSAARRTMSRR